jgi:Spy/CpxP family protein refolding chaperone
MTQKPKLKTALLIGFAAALLVVVGAVAGTVGSEHFQGMHGFHGKGVMHARMGYIIGKLDLNDSQMAQMEKVRDIVETRVREKAPLHREEVHELVAAISEGKVENTEVRAAIDSHLEEFRVVAYEVSDELVALANSLDDDQRATLREEIRKAHEKLEKNQASH